MSLCFILSRCTVLVVPIYVDTLAVVMHVVRKMIKNGVRHTSRDRTLEVRVVKVLLTVL